MPPVPPTTVAPANEFHGFKSSYLSDGTGNIHLIFLPVSAYKQVSVTVATQGVIGVVLTWNIVFGCETPSGMYEVVTAQFPNDDGKVHTFPVVAPFIRIFATGGLPNTAIALVGWVYAN